VVTLSHGGYMKAQKLDEYRAQKRGGRGKQAASTKEDDFVDNLFIANTHDYILCFSSRGQVYWIKVYDVPQGSRASRGKPIINLLRWQKREDQRDPAGEGIQRGPFHLLRYLRRHREEDAVVGLCQSRKAGIIAINLDEGDFLIGVALTDGKHDVMLFSDEGRAVRFDEDDVRPLSRNTRGVRA